MRSLTNRLVALLLAFVTVSSFMCAPACANNNKNSEEKTSQASEQISIQTCQIQTEDAETTPTSVGFLNLFNKRLSLRDTDCEHEFDEITVAPTCKRVGYTVFYCYLCEYSYMDDFQLPSAHEFAEFNATYNDKEELHRICTVCEYEEIAEEKKHTRYFTGNDVKEIVWTSYKATLEQREERAKALAKMGIVLHGDKVVNDVPGYVWDFLMERIGNPYGVAGVMGNLYAESGMRSINLQNTYEHSLGYSDQEYTDVVDSGAYSYDSFRTDEAGYGLAQWTSGGRKANLYKYAESTNRSIGDLDMQLEFLWRELISGYPRLVSTLQNANSIREASTAFLTQFERPADQGPGVQTARAGFGENYFIAYN
jgi:hypothetical protein